MMRIISFVGNLLKWKIAAATLAGAVLVGGTGIALAFTPMGHDVAQTLAGSNHAMTTPTHMSGNKATNHTTTTTHGQSQQNNAASTCPGDSQAQQLAKEFSLSTDKNGSAMQTICALHDGTFQETINGKSVPLDHPLGYGEIEQLLMDARSLAEQNGIPLTSDNVQQYVKVALSACNTTSLESCINGSSGEMTGMSTSHTTGKPTTTPPSHGHGKATSTHIPSANK
jgi:hypothetical protein